MNETLKKTLKSALKENDSHCTIIQENRNLLSKLFPLTLEKLENLEQTINNLNLLFEEIPRFIALYHGLEQQTRQRLEQG